METINHEYYVALEVAKLLKEVGFDWDTLTYYPIDDEVLNERALVGSEVAFNHNRDDSAFSAPTLNVAQRWLREVKGNNVDVISVQASDTKKLFVEYDVVINKNGTLIYQDLYESLKSGVYPIDSHARTYEEALEAGIKKSLEIILKKGE